MTEELKFLNISKEEENLPLGFSLEVIVKAYGVRAEMSARNGYDAIRLKDAVKLGNAVGRILVDNKDDLAGLMKNKRLLQETIEGYIARSMLNEIGYLISSSLTVPASLQLKVDPDGKAYMGVIISDRGIYYFDHTGVVKRIRARELSGLAFSWVEKTDIVEDALRAYFETLKENPGLEIVADDYSYLKTIYAGKEKEAVFV